MVNICSYNAQMCNIMEKEKFLSKIARLYYISNLNQQQIADKLSISRTKVSRYLDKARKDKVVEIKINSPVEAYEELELEIENTYGLNECLIVPSYENRQEVLSELSRQLNKLLERILNKGNYIGIGWGTTLKDVTDNLEFDKNYDVRVIPIIGGLGKIGTGIHTNSIASKLAEKLGGVSYIINTPAVLDRREAKEVIENDSNTREIMELSERVHIAILGMGEVGGDSTLLKNGNFSREEFDYLERLGVVGDVNLVFIDKTGNHIDNRIDERIIRIPEEKIKKIKTVIGIGFGKKKIDVILGAIRGKIINVLLTDEITAKGILRR